MTKRKRNTLLSAKTRRNIRKVTTPIKKAIRFIWDRPILVILLLLLAAYFLSSQIITRTLEPQLKCTYLLTMQLDMDRFFCDGITITEPVFNNELFRVPGLTDVMDPPLRFIRTLIAWAVVIFFAFISVYLTIIYNNFKSVVKLITFNKQQWQAFMASFRIWLLFFIFFCLVFYFTVIR